MFSRSNLQELIKWILFSLEAIVLLVLIGVNYKVYYAIVPASVLLAISSVFKGKFSSRFKKNIPWYVVDFVALVTIAYFSGDSYLQSGFSYVSTLYMIILTNFYSHSPGLKSNIAYGCVSFAAYVVCLLCGTLLSSNPVNEVAVEWMLLANRVVDDLLLFFLHFVICNLAFTLLRYNKELQSNIKEAENNRRELLIAYEKLEGATQLEERNRIAKEIHDTAGHSITTVIMQTEAAKLLMDTDPKSAKQRVNSANVFAKNALEELREAVHLLSEVNDYEDLKSRFERVLSDTALGTDIAVKSDIGELTLGAEQSRFLYNALKEGLSNGIRHGGSTAFYFECKQVNDEVRFLLSDNGKGADMSTFQEGFGLTALKKKAARLGASVEFQSEPNEGFEIRITLKTEEKIVENQSSDR